MFTSVPGAWSSGDSNQIAQVDEECLKLRHLSSLSMDNEFQARGRIWRIHDNPIPIPFIWAFYHPKIRKITMFKTIVEKPHAYIHMQPPIMLNTVITPNNRYQNEHWAKGVRQGTWHLEGDGGGPWETWRFWRCDRMMNCLLFISSKFPATRTDFKLIALIAMIILR